MNKPLTPEEAKNLTFPCLLEVWDDERCNSLYVVEGFIKNKFLTLAHGSWHNAALPSTEITEAMRKQFAPNSEYPKRMLVWNDNESRAKPRIVIAYLGEKAVGRYIFVANGDECEFENEEEFDWFYFKNAKPIPDPDPISQEIEELRQRLAYLEAKHSQQS